MFKKKRTVRNYLLGRCFGYLNKRLCHLWRRPSEGEPCSDYFLFSAWDPRKGQTHGIFLSGSDLHRGHYSQDDVVIRYAGFHDAAFDVNCEERRSRSRFIPPSSFASSLPKDVQTSDHRRRTHVSFLLRSSPRPEDDQAPLHTPLNSESLGSDTFTRPVAITVFLLDSEDYPWIQSKFKRKMTYVWRFPQNCNIFCIL